MREVKDKVYTIDELSDKARAKAIDSYRNGLDFPFLSEELTEFIKEQLEKKKIEVINLTVQYSLNYCQGDGLSFIGKFIVKNGKKRYLITIKPTNMYVHERSTSFDIDDYDHATYDYDIQGKVLDRFKEWYYDVCKKAELMGYDAIEYETDEKNIIEYFKDNGTEFYNDGSRY